jgi:hypothetical protein
MEEQEEEEHMQQHAGTLVVSAPPPSPPSSSSSSFHATAAKPVHTPTHTPHGISSVRGSAALNLFFET